MFPIFTATSVKMERFPSTIVHPDDRFFVVPTYDYFIIIKFIH